MTQGRGDGRTRCFGIDPGIDGAIAMFDGKEFQIKAWHGLQKDRQAEMCRRFIIRHTGMIDKVRIWICRGAGFRPNIVAAQGMTTGYIEAKVEDLAEALTIQYDLTARADAGLNAYAKEHGMARPTTKDDAHATFLDFINQTGKEIRLFWETGENQPDGLDACIAALAMWKCWERMQ